jgi:hypothetical protein
LIHGIAWKLNVIKTSQTILFFLHMFTGKKWQNMKCCMHIFEGSIIEEEAAQAYKLQSLEPTNQLVKPANTGYHRECYSHFTKIKQAQRRREKAVLAEEMAKEGWYYIV